RLATGEIPTLKDFQIARRLRIESHKLVGRVTLQPVQIGQGVRLSVAQVDDDRARGLRLKRAVFATVSLQGRDAEMIEQRPPRRHRAAFNSTRGSSIFVTARISMPGGC